MHHQNTLLHDLGKAMPRWRFEQLAKRHGADRRVRTLPCWSQFVALVFAQFAGVTSLRELVAALASHANHAYHLGLGPIRRSTLAEANAKRPLALYEAVFLHLLARLARANLMHRKTIADLLHPPPRPGPRPASPQLALDLSHVLP